MERSARPRAEAAPRTGGRAPEGGGRSSQEVRGRSGSAQEGRGKSGQLSGEAPGRSLEARGGRLRARAAEATRTAQRGQAEEAPRRARGKQFLSPEFAPNLMAEELGLTPKPLAPPPLTRRALSHVGGDVELSGDEALGEVLRRALQVTSEEDEVRAHVHGFHSYPARLHPVTARILVQELAGAGRRVLDPFCGSGTVAVEARIAGARVGASDANPFAVELARLKTGGVVEGLVEAATRVTEQAEERRERKAGPTERYGEVDRELFDVHVLLELDGLKAAIQKEPAPLVRRALSLVLTSLLTKVSRSPGDTRRATMKRRLASGFTIQSFQAKAEELAERLHGFQELLPRGAFQSHLEVSDARRLDYVRTGTVDLVVSSPPYPGVYDYVKHHETRMRWLGLETEGFARSEIGAQRRAKGQDFARAAGGWDREMAPCLHELARGLAPRGVVVLVVADTVLGERAWYADRALAQLAPKVGLRQVAVASQRRPLFLRGAEQAFATRPRREHLLALAQA